MKAVKPAAGLVYCFADVIRRKMPIESLLILERVVPLCVRHGAGIEPAVNNLGDAVVAAPVVRMCEDDPIYSRSVQVQVLQGMPAEGLQFCQGTNADEIAFSVCPDRQGRAPEAFARKRPVYIVLEPVAESPVADGFRDPVDGSVQLDHAIPHVSGPDVPGVLCVVNQRVTRPPAERVIV